MRVNEPAAHGGQCGWLKKKKIIDSDNGKRGKKLTQTRVGNIQKKTLEKITLVSINFC